MKEDSAEKIEIDDTKLIEPKSNFKTQMSQASVVNVTFYKFSLAGLTREHKGSERCVRYIPWKHNFVYIDIHYLYDVRGKKVKQNLKVAPSPALRYLGWSSREQLKERAPDTVSSLDSSISGDSSQTYSVFVWNHSSDQSTRYSKNTISTYSIYFYV